MSSREDILVVDGLVDDIASDELLKPHWVDSSVILSGLASTGSPGDLDVVKCLLEKEAQCKEEEEEREGDHETGLPAHKQAPLVEECLETVL